MTEQTFSDPILAFLYDFDGTLCDGNLIDQQMLGDLGVASPQRFWADTNAKAKQLQADRVCTYMHELIKLCHSRDKPLSQAQLTKYGGNGKLRLGLTGPDNWFERLGRKCQEAGFKAHHYIISSGIGEMIDSCLAAHELDGYFTDAGQSHVFASRFFYENEIAVAPAWTVNYTTKTQFVFRINKGKLALGDDKAPNEYMSPAARPVPFENMIFIGDGYSDIPCFSLIKQQGGFAMAVLDSDKQSEASLRQIESLVGDNRVDAIGLIDPFVSDSQLERRVAKIISKNQATRRSATRA